MMRISHAADNDDGEERKDVLGKLLHVRSSTLGLGVVKVKNQFYRSMQDISVHGQSEEMLFNHSRGSRGRAGSIGGKALELVEVKNETKAAISSCLLSKLNS